MRVGLYADYSRFSGYGNDAVDLALALDKMGVDVLPLPRHLTPGLPARFTRLLEKSPLDRPDVVVAYVDPGGLNRNQVARMRMPVVVWTMWERTPFVPGDLVDPDDFDMSWAAEFIVSCPMNVEAFTGSFPDRRIEIIPAGVDVTRWPRRKPGDRDRSQPVRFLLSGVLSERKNPFALLDVWRQLKQGVPGFDAELTLHSTGGNLHPGVVEAYGPGVTLLTERLSHEDLVGLYLSHDVYVAPARGEGNNKPAMEFMATGGLVVASDWGGHQNWLHRDYAIPVGGALAPCPYQPGTSWFEVDKEELASAVVTAWQMPEHQRLRSGALAAEAVRGMTWKVAAEKMMGVVGRAVATKA